MGFWWGPSKKTWVRDKNRRNFALRRSWASYWLSGLFLTPRRSRWDPSERSPEPSGRSFQTLLHFFHSIWTEPLLWETTSHKPLICSRLAPPWIGSPNSKNPQSYVRKREKSWVFHHFGARSWDVWENLKIHEISTFFEQNLKILKKIMKKKYIEFENVFFINII